MKSKIAFIALLLCSSVFSQVTKLSTLSSNDFLGSEIIYEDNKTDIWGYFLVYSKNQKSKDLFELEYVLLDKNLNKIASKEFLQSRFSSMMSVTMPNIGYAEKKQDAIYFSMVNSQYGAYFAEAGLPWMRKIDLKTFEVSDQFLLDSMVKTVKAKKDENKIREYKNVNLLNPLGGNGFMVFDDELSSTQRTVAFFRGKAVPYKGFYFYDLDLNQKWYYPFNQSKKSKYFNIYSFVKADEDDLLFLKKGKEDYSDGFLNSLIVIDKNTGKLKYEMKLDDSKKFHHIKKIDFNENTIVVYSAFQKANKDYYFDSTEIEGFYKTVFDRTNGKEVSKDYFIWDAFKNKFAFKGQYGEIEDYGYLHFIDFKTVSNGNTIAYAEGFKPQNSTKILDAYVMEFDSKMNIIQLKKIEKTINALNAKVWGKEIEKHYAFDYIYSQNIGKDNFSFFYTDNEKTGSAGRSNPSWVLGIVTYVDGQFDTQKITLTTKNGSITPIRAKNGYVLLKEIFDDNKNSEIRLEKINL